MSAHGTAGIVFPSVEWFQALQRLVNDDPEFRRLGTVDATMGVKVGEKVFIIVFEAYECTEVKEGTEYDLIDADFFLEMTVELWRDLATNIRGKQRRRPESYPEYPGFNDSGRHLRQRYRRPTAGRHLFPG